MGKLKYAVILILVSYCLLLTACGKQAKSLEEQLAGTIFSEMNFEIDKENREVYETEHYAIQMTDSQWSEGMFYCVLAAWCKDGTKERLAEDHANNIGSEQNAEKIDYGCEPIITSSVKTYYVDGITYMCYSGIYTTIREDLTFSLYLLQSNVEPVAIASWKVAPKEVTDELEKVQLQKDNYTVYKQSDGSLIIKEDKMRCHITKLGIYFSDTKEFEEKEAVLVDENGKELTVSFRHYSRSGDVDFRGVWPAKEYISVQNLEKLQINDKVYEL